MCSCEEYLNLVDLPHLKIYLIMANYRAKENVIIITNGKRYILGELQETELAYLYEDLGFTKHIEKITNTENESEEKEGSTKKKAKKSNRKSSKKD